MIVAAARQAEADAGLDIAREPDRVGVAAGTGMGGLRRLPGVLRDGEGAWRRPGQPVLDRRRSCRTAVPAGSRSSSARKGPLSLQCTACAASQMALGDGVDADPARACGRDARGRRGGPHHPAGRGRLRGDEGPLHAQRRPPAASRPFDADRDGFVLCEGGALLVLEESSTRGRAARGSTPRSPATAPPPTRTTSPPPPRAAGPARHARRCGRRHRAGGDRLRQRARHLDPAERRGETRALKPALGEHAHRSPSPRRSR